MRQRISFRAVNRPGGPGYDSGLQRHHILPRQMLSQRAFIPLFAALGHDRLCFDDFRHNGLLLPANDGAAVRVGLPLHRGPHRRYNEIVMERFGQIERGWAGSRHRDPELALREALERLRLLQRALRRRLLNQERRIRLNRRDPLGAGVDFTDLDAMAESLWPATEPG
ncbi:MAG: AHH domain-containing protein [Proteobacteria bacterium]|nr:AHH domain-containing protein [Pseudomonadota bacterium]